VNLTINGQDFGRTPIDLLAERLAGLADVPRAEVWLNNEGRALCLLKSQDRAMLMLLREDGDPGLTSRATDLNDDREMEFTLSNGQVDKYPARWTVPFAEARRAAEFFWFKESPAPFIAWHDDAG
jgi:hypothetical protein